jgi:predicted PurR-regulated permease PerM
MGSCMFNYLLQRMKQNACNIATTTTTTTSNILVVVVILLLLLFDEKHFL